MPQAPSPSSRWQALVDKAKGLLNTPQPLAGPQPGGQPLAGPQPGAAELASPQAAPTPPPTSLIDKVKNTIKSLFGDKPTKAAPLPNGPPPLEIQRMMLRQSGRARTKLLLKYNGAWRMCQPYSYRQSKKPGGEARFFMWCELHSEIHGIYLSRIQGLVMTDETFIPKWPIELI